MSSDIKKYIYFYSTVTVFLFPEITVQTVPDFTVVLFPEITVLLVPVYINPYIQKTRTQVIDFRKLFIDKNPEKLNSWMENTQNIRKEKIEHIYLLSKRKKRSTECYYIAIEQRNGRRPH